MHHHGTSTGSKNSSKVLTCTHDSNRLERGRGRWRGEEEGGEGKREVERGRGRWRGEEGGGEGKREMEREGRKKESRKRRNAIMLPAHWIALFPDRTTSWGVGTRLPTEHGQKDRT